MFDLNAFILNTFVILFFTLAIGNLFGKVKFGKFSFGISGPLFIGLFIGYFVTLFAANIPEGNALYERAQAVIGGTLIEGNLTSLFLVMFIVASGLLASKDMKYALKQFGKEFIILSILIPVVGAASAYGISYLADDISPYEVTGTLNGSLTSSSGLGAALGAANENARNVGADFENLSEQSQANLLDTLNDVNQRNAELRGTTYEEKTVQNTETLTEQEINLLANEAEAGVGVGYSIGYPFGVLAVILAVNFLPMIFNIDVKKEIIAYQSEKADYEAASGGVDDDIKETDFDIIGFSTATFLGYLLGSIEIPLGALGSFSLGNVGGGMIMALILGTIGQIGPVKFRMSNVVLGQLRQFFLSAFLAGTGLNYGYRVVQSLTGSGLAIVFISVMVAFLAILAGFLVGRYVFKINWTVLSGAITGGMTSAPGLGAAIDAVGVDDPATGYGATQPIATLMMVILSIIIYQLPLPI